MNCGDPVTTIRSPFGVLADSIRLGAEHDAASHGDSSAEAFSSLPRFAEDLAAVRDALRRHPAIDTGRIGLLGHSVGAAAVLLHTARQGGVRAVVSLSAFAGLARMIAGFRAARRG